MRLFMHNPEVFRYNIQYADHKKGVSISCTDNDIHIEYFAKTSDDLPKIELLVDWFLNKMASSLPLEELQQSIQAEIDAESGKAQFPVF
ncbi:uncharacterized protein [Blastocystis hominis]|uniref:Uncharacterized protein n=1 Tax=Blastocystis hominis TaxID=12968 RepID=D8M503_BLAHO|nr:uncharacterized protein [Blastocystis hominis]CBK23142.2 unnamed protein product [Blastocystis hominis]|eukprot:XP_012897190.1 uncharacterized protein [Blastocystis hominis]